ncbi:MAG: cysteine peptidase family C39 domain-containing protein [Gammaproteobacteria bacterium]
MAQQKGYQAAGFKLTVGQLPQLLAPVIVHVQPFGYHHFAVLRGVAGDRVYLADPGRGNLRMSIARFLDEWAGVVFVLGRGEKKKSRVIP